VPKYKAVLFAPDGDWVTDFRECKTIEEVQENLCDMGSRWYFYPFHAVIRDNGALTTNRQRLVDVAYPFAEQKGIAIKTFAKFLNECDRDYLAAVLEG
jgi:hypothetical protein